MTDIYNDQRRCRVFVCFRLVVRGQIQEEAVLCSQTATYEMKVVDVSNTMLICPRLRTPEDSSKVDV